MTSHAYAMQLYILHELLRRSRSGFTSREIRLRQGLFVDSYSSDPHSSQPCSRPLPCVLLLFRNVAGLAAACSATEGLPSFRRSPRIESLQTVTRLVRSFFSRPKDWCESSCSLSPSCFRCLRIPACFTPQASHAPPGSTCSHLARSHLHGSDTARGIANAMAT